ncbi:MAG: DUF4175 family protein [Planctomycetota bacterium]
MMKKNNVASQALELPDSVAHALARFAQIVRRIQLWRAASWLLFAVILGFTFIAVCDRWLMINDGLRRGLALLVYALSIALAWRLIRKVFRSCAVAEVALALEQRAPKEQLQERISTTVELANRHRASSDSNDGLSEVMIQRVAHEASARVQSLNVETLPDRTPARRACKFAGVVIGVMLCLCLAPDLSMPLAYVRAFLPWLNLPRPSNTAIEVLTNSTRVVDGESVNIQARITRKGKPIDDEACLEVKIGNTAWQHLYMDHRPTEGVPRVSSEHASETAATPKNFALKVGPLHERLKYRICAGDGQSAVYEIDVLPRPEVAGIKVIVHYPAYTELQAQTFDHSNGDLSVLKGSRVELLVTANIALAAAGLEFADARRLSLVVEEHTARGEFEVTVDTSYRIRLRSQDDVSNPDAPLLFIHVTPDMPPRVTVFKPRADEDVEVNAILLLEARGEDDLGIKAMRLVAQSTQSHQPITLPLERPVGSSKVWMVSQLWDIAGLFLEDAAIVNYRVEVVDSNGAVGKSDERRVRIASNVKRQHGLLLTQLDEAQKLLLSARTLLGSVQWDVKEMRLVFRAADTEFQAAERLLLTETIVRVVREVKSASSAVEKGLPHAESGKLQTLLKGLTNCLDRFADTAIRPLHRAALQAHSPQSQAVAAGLDVIAELFPKTEKELEDYHEALTAAHRYVETSQLEIRAIDVRDTQTKIMPVLVGSAGWTPKGTVIPGLLAEYYQGTNFKTLVRRMVETDIRIRHNLLVEFGAEGFSVRWQGQILAPKAGRYIFRTEDDGLRLSVAGKRLFDQCKVVANTVRSEPVNKPVRGEGVIELSAGWHDILIEYAQRENRKDVVLQRSGPDIPNGPLPTEHLRTTGIPVVALTDGRVRATMAQAASETAIKYALTRLQTMVDSARSLPPKLARVATLPPKPDPQGMKDGDDWRKAVETQTLELDWIKAVTPALAIPLLQWSNHAGVWVNNYKAVRERYRQAMLQWVTKLAHDVFKIASDLRQLQKDADSTHFAFNKLVEVARQPSDVKRDMAMAKADATVRALAEDLRQQAGDIAAQLHNAATEVKRPVNERRALQALEHKVEAIARGAAADLDRRLAESKTPDALAKSEQNVPNFGTHAGAIREQAGSLAKMAERVERAVALRNELKEDATEFAVARDALTKPPSIESAAAQKQSAANLKENVKDLQDAVANAVGHIGSEVIQQATRVNESALPAKAAAQLEKRASKHTPMESATTTADQQAHAETGKELDKLAKTANEAASAIDKNLGEMANAWNDSATAALKEAANQALETGKAVAEIPQDKKAPAATQKLNQAANAAEAARRLAEQTAEKLALNAEAKRDRNAVPEQRAQADDLTRLATAIRQEVNEKLDPAAHMLDRIRREGLKEDTPLLKDAPAQAKVAATELNKLADIAANLESDNPKLRQQGHEALDKALAEKGLKDQLNAALKTANTLDELANHMDKGGEPNAERDQKQPKQENSQERADKNDPLAAAKELDAERQALAKVMNTELPADANHQALAAQMNKLAQELRQESDQNRRTADNLDRAGGLEQQARDKLKKEGVELAKALREAGKEAGNLAKAVSGQPLTAPLNNAGKSLPQAGQETEDLARQADSKPLGELADKLGNLAKGLEKPVGEIAAALGQPDDKNTQQAQNIGQKARHVAGREADLANELRMAERAEQLARANAETKNGDREQLEKQVRKTIEALDRQGALPSAALDDLAALRNSVKQGQGNEQGKQPAKNGQGNEQGKQPAKNGQGNEQGKQPAKNGQGNEQGKQPAKNGQGNEQGKQPAKSGRSGGQQEQPNMEQQAQQSRAEAERLATMATRMDRLAAGLLENQIKKSQQPDESAQTPLANALNALTNAKAALETGDAAQAEALRNQSAQLLGQAAEAARSQAMSQGQSQGQKGNQQTQAKDNDGSQGGGSLQSSKGGRAPNPPKELPIDQTTWNRLPDNLRRDLLNAAGGRFPAEYEMSIRRYFKNIAASKAE